MTSLCLAHQYRQGSSLSLTVFRVVPESTGRLLQKGKTEDSPKIIMKSSAKDRVTLSEKARILEDIKMEGEGDHIYHMFTHPGLLVRSFIVF